MRLIKDPSGMVVDGYGFYGNVESKTIFYLSVGKRWYRYDDSERLAEQYRGFRQCLEPKRLIDPEVVCSASKLEFLLITGVPFEVALEKLRCQCQRAAEREMQVVKEIEETNI